ncbi:hypothetical protein [Atlantibacter hermannii]|uniref:hypothetical protein n=1 Tax=Atlantibacter hermannii TaxID=565 RepID=UPI0028AD2AEF|nr:hypothetical protein [Atlantibacter hermannii]
MTINERVSEATINEILAGCIEGVEPTTHEIAMAAEIKQYRAAADKPVAVVDIQSGRKDGNKFAVVFTREGQALPDDIYYLHAAPQVTSVQEEYAIKASGISDVLKDAADYAPLTAGQWHTLVKNWHQTFCGLAEGVAAPAVQQQDAQEEKK